MNQHISQQYNSALDDLKTEFLALGGIVEQQIIKAVKSITDVDVDLAAEVMAVEKEVDKREIVLDDLCTQIIARRQPTASDLRLVMAISKATRDLERMGDEANKIAKMAIAISESETLPHGFSELRNLGRQVQDEVNITLTAFARYDVDMALQVVDKDEEIDREYATAMRELITYMMEDPRNISRAMSIIWSLRSLERIGDHAGNISEQVIYLVKGLDIRHKTADEVAEQVSQD
ncbi:phosphate transport system regulatory protein PhoU [Candidatus Endobugula sertula]|uniref:Phosphate-specific transport system accessory protein PhoU n=1 Tax=Candidatus Endobugula sertula TaxID=62101 RepID=A0A1D2QR36_9GAMM|nr:phosphate transport system regulatory protein PhoU [Candidatus Endobugula sertula]